MVDAVGTTHHIELAGHMYMLRPGSYMKKAAPTFGARFSTGDPDFNNLSMWQHWAQKCFVGGFDQDLWADDAMYDEGIGLDTTDHEKVRLTRDMTQGTGANWAISSSTTAAQDGFQAIVYQNRLYVLCKPTTGVESKLWRYDESTDGWTRITALDAKNIRGMCAAVFDGKLYIGGTDSVSGNAKLVYDDGALTSWTTQTNPSGMSTAGNAIHVMRAFGGKLYVAYGVNVWRQKNDQTWDGNTVFYKASSTSTSNYIVAMEIHLGFLYMLSQNAHVHRTDGNSSFDIWNWDGQTQGTAIRSFDGRLFILTFEFTNTTDTGWGVLYQMSGSAMTQLKRFGDENQATRIGNMVAYDRHLFYGASNLLGFGSRPGFGVAVYDPVEDAHSVMATNSDTTTWSRGAAPYTNHIVDDLVFWNGTLFIFVRAHGAFKTPYKYRDHQRGQRRFDVTKAGVSVGPTNGGWLTTSTYDAGTPGVKKLWRKITIDAEVVTNTAFVLEYSVNNGTSWTEAGRQTVANARRQYDYHLNNVISTSLKLRITLRSTSATATPTFYGYVVSYIPVPEPNWMWSFTIVCSQSQQLMDGTTRAIDSAAEIDYLSYLYRNKALVTFTDVDGIKWEYTGAPGVFIYDMTVNLRDLTRPLEGEVTVTLLEAVETY